MLSDELDASILLCASINKGCLKMKHIKMFWITIHCSIHSSMRSLVTRERPSTLSVLILVLPLY